MKERKKPFLWGLEYKTLLIVLVLVIIGIITIMNASTPIATGAERGVGDIIRGLNMSIVRTQLLWFGLGLVCIIGLQFIDYSIFEKRWLWIFILSVGILVALLIFGEEKRGTKGWLPIGSFSIQPSEVCKISLILVLSALMAKFDKIKTPRDALPAIGAFLVFFILVIMQKDLGTSLVYLGILFGMMFIGGMKLRYLGGFIGSLAVLAVPIWFFFLKQYQKLRILSFISPTDSYQVAHSKIIFGSGGFTGKGLFNDSALSRQGYLPDHTTDFIFAVLGETFGFIGAILVLALYGLLIARLWQISKNAKDKFGSYVVFGIICMLFIHIFENVGMTIGVMPVTGIPLPFISYGGSSFLSNMIAIGIAMNIGRKREKKGIFSK